MPALGPCCCGEAEGIAVPCCPDPVPEVLLLTGPSGSCGVTWDGISTWNGCYGFAATTFDKDAGGGLGACNPTGVTAVTKYALECTTPAPFSWRLRVTQYVCQTSPAPPASHATCNADGSVSFAPPFPGVFSDFRDFAVVPGWTCGPLDLTFDTSGGAFPLAYDRGAVTVTEAP